MSQTDLNVANGTGAAVRADINDHLGALVTQSAGATAPSTTFANQLWFDTTAGVLKRRNNANTAWTIVHIWDQPSRTALASASIPAGVDRLVTGGYSNPGDGGGAEYKRVGAEPSHALKVQSADGAWWELVPDPMGIDLRQAGAVNDDATDAAPAINAILGFIGVFEDLPNKALPRILVNGHYFVNATIELKATVHILGLGSGTSGVKGSRLRFPANTTGIIVHRGITEGAGTVGTPSGAADGSIIEGIELVSDGGTIANITDDTKGHGIWLRARAVLRNIKVDAFPGNGVQIIATQGSGDPAREGNANNWVIEFLTANNNHLSGLFVDGADVNAGYSVLVNASDNGRAGILDSSFLGNKHDTPHTAGNGTATKGENGAGESYWVDFDDGGGFKQYIAAAGATEAQLVATTPGTNANVWIEVDTGAGGSNIPTWTASQPEGTFFVGGPFVGNSANAVNGLFENPYSENGYPQIVRPWMFFGGHRSGNIKGSGGGLNSSTNNGLVIRGSSVVVRNQDQFSPDRNHELVFNRATNEILALQAASGGRQSITWTEGSGIWELFKHNGLNTGARMFVTTALTTETFGRASAPAAGQIGFINGFWLGGGFSGARHMTNGTAAPTSGEWARGDIVWNREPSAGGKVGWVCTTGGTAGSTAVFKPFGAIDA